MVTKIIFPALDKAQKPYYCVSKNPHVSAVFTTALLGSAPARSTRASAANHRESISACRRDDLGVANVNVTSQATDHACPQHFCAPLGRLRRARISAVSSFAIGADRSDGPFRGFLPRKTTPRDLYRVT
jgi:hypothetical protein